MKITAEDSRALLERFGKAGHASAWMDHLRAALDREAELQAELEKLKAAADTDGWNDNTGVQPVDGDVLVDLELDSGIVRRSRARLWRWNKTGDSSSGILRWRLSR